MYKVPFLTLLLIPLKAENAPSFVYEAISPTVPDEQLDYNILLHSQYADSRYTRDYIRCSIQIKESLFEKCYSFGSLNFTSGGSLSAYNSQILIYNTTFKENIAKNGGAIAIKDTKMYICNDQNVTVFLNNIGYSTGGAIYGESDSNNLNVYLSNTIFFRNEGKSYGGAIFISGLELLIENTIFRENKGYFSGGAIFTKNSDITIFRTRFISNMVSTNPDYLFNRKLNGKYFQYFNQNSMRGGGGISVCYKKDGNEHEKIDNDKNNSEVYKIVLQQICFENNSAFYPGSEQEMPGSGLFLNGNITIEAIGVMFGHESFNRNHIAYSKGSVIVSNIYSINKTDNIECSGNQSSFEGFYEYPYQTNTKHSTNYDKSIPEPTQFTYQATPLTRFPYATTRSHIYKYPTSNINDTNITKYKTMTAINTPIPTPSYSPIATREYNSFPIRTPFPTYQTNTPVFGMTNITVTTATEIVTLTNVIAHTKTNVLSNEIVNTLTSLYTETFTQLENSVLTLTITEKAIIAPTIQKVNEETEIPIYKINTSTIYSITHTQSETETRIWTTWLVSVREPIYFESETASVTTTYECYNSTSYDGSTQAYTFTNITSYRWIATTTFTLQAGSGYVTTRIIFYSDQESEEYIYTNITSGTAYIPYEGCSSSVLVPSIFNSLYLTNYSEYVTHFFIPEATEIPYSTLSQQPLFYTSTIPTLTYTRTRTNTEVVIFVEDGTYDHNTILDVWTNVDKYTSTYVSINRDKKPESITFTKVHIVERTMTDVTGSRYSASITKRDVLTDVLTLGYTTGNSFARTFFQTKMSTITYTSTLAGSTYSPMSSYIQAHSCISAVHTYTKSIYLTLKSINGKDNIVIQTYDNTYSLTNLCGPAPYSFFSIIFTTYRDYNSPTYTETISNSETLTHIEETPKYTPKSMCTNYNSYTITDVSNTIIFTYSPLYFITSFIKGVLRPIIFPSKYPKMD